MFRIAREEDVAAVVRLYEKAIDGEEAGTPQIGWLRGVYPTLETARKAFWEQDLYVYEEDGLILASAIINQEQPDSYAEGKWSASCDVQDVYVLHTLVVDSTAKGRGIGRRFVAFYEECARTAGCSYLRMDTNEINQPARALYASLGYNEVDVVPCDFNGIKGIRLVLLEKRLGA